MLFNQDCKNRQLQDEKIEKDGPYTVKPNELQD